MESARINCSAVIRVSIGESYKDSLKERVNL
jgi:hypothetical protein